ncbi:Polyribonucleotide nucleotidyltransferase [archaeon HR01]|nr:Polyribonucleotide nucleotidyltransferase [archaeon HR01]
MIYFKEAELVVPGQLLSDNGRRSGPGTYTMNGKVYAAQAGIAKAVEGVVRVIPVSGRYRPERGDKVLGIVSDIKPNVVEVDLGGDIKAVLRMSERESPPLKLTLGDVIQAEVKSAGLRGIFLDLEGLQKVKAGILVNVNPAKVPRLIGRKGSMIQMLKRETGCDFWVGRNGLVVVSGRSPASEFAAIAAINLIEREAHKQGLTERVTQLIKTLLEGG